MSIDVKEILDEVRDLTKLIKELLEATFPEGATEYYEYNLSNTTKSIVPPIKPWFSVFVMNDGPSDITVSTFYGNNITVKSGERLGIESARGIIKGLTIATSGDASVRILCLR